MTVGKPSAIGVYRVRTTRANAATFYESPSLPLGTKTQIFQKQQSTNSESVVDTDHIDILWPQSGHFISALA